MKKALFGYGIGILHYIVFYTIISIMFKGKIPPESNLAAYCAMWLWIFFSLMQIIASLIDKKFFTNKGSKRKGEGEEKIT